jgi:hypothetical protein
MIWTEQRKLEIIRKIGLMNSWGEVDATPFKPCPKQRVDMCNSYTEPCKDCTISESCTKGETEK